MASKVQQLTPLLDIQSAAFAEQYERGVRWSRHGEGQGRGPFSIRSLKATLERSGEQRSCEQQDPSWGHHIGFFIGMYHGGVLSPHTGQLRPGVSALIVFDHPDTTRGYRVGRRRSFMKSNPAIATVSMRSSNTSTNWSWMLPAGKSQKAPGTTR